MNCAFKQIQRQNTISMNSCIQYKTKNRKEKKRQMSRYAIKKLKMKYELGADASKAMIFAMTCVMAAAREHISYTSTIVISPFHLPL